MTFPDLTKSTSDWTLAQRRRAALLCTVIGLGVTFVVGPRYGELFKQTDAFHYLSLAAGQPAMLPFASRQLGPLIVRGLVDAFGISIQTAYILEGTVAMLAFFATVLWFLLRSGTPRFMFAATFGLFFWSCQFSGLVLPDLLYSALLSGFLLLLYRQQFFLAALMMLPLTVSRESTMLTLVCFLFAGWRRLRLSEAAVAFASLFAGMVIVKHLTANALPNHENISPFLYLFAKMPWAFLKNFLGIFPWSNVYPECEVPRWQTNFHFGPVHAIGICGFHSFPPLLMLFHCLASFGLFPVLFLFIRRFRKPLAPAAETPRAAIFLRFCVAYGVISFALAGLLGETFQRLFAYSWPVFLVALPILLVRARVTFTSNRAAIAFLGLHFVLSWCDIHRENYHLAPLEIAFWIAGWFVLRKTLKSTAESLPGAAPNTALPLL